MQGHDHGHRDHEAEDRHRRQGGGEGEVGEPRESPDQHVLRIAGDRCRRADVGGHRHREQIRHRIAAEGEGEVEHQRRQDQADRVIDEERGGDARHHDDGGEERDRPVRTCRHPGGGEREETGEPQVGDHDHHPEQEGDGVDVDGPIGRRQGHGARSHHQAGADQRDARPVDGEARHPADRQGKVARGENPAGGDAPGRFIVGRHQPRREGSGSRKDEERDNDRQARPMGERAITAGGAGHFRAHPLHPWPAVPGAAACAGTSLSR